MRRRALKARLLSILLYEFLGCPRAAAVVFCREPTTTRSFGFSRSLGAGLPRGTAAAGPLALIFSGFGFGFFAFALSLLLAARGFAEAVRLVYTTTVTRARRRRISDARFAAPAGRAAAE